MIGVALMLIVAAVLMAASAPHRGRAGVADDPVGPNFTGGEAMYLGPEHGKTE